jgi:hypothetical protein
MAADRDGRIVNLGAQALFSTDTGDAWLLDVEDRLALPLARDGDRVPVRMVEADSQFGVGWTHEYRVDGELFTVLEQATGRVTIVSGYPTAKLPQPRVQATAAVREHREGTTAPLDPDTM